VSRRQILVLGLVALCSTAAGVMHYAGATAVATFVISGFAFAGLAWFE
jgi:hypothetical protein